jgi:hypothetical protein
MKKYLYLLALSACAVGGSVRLGDISGVPDNSSLDFTSISDDMKLIGPDGKPVSGTYKTELGKVVALYTYSDGELVKEQKFVHGKLKAESADGMTLTYFEDGSVSGRLGRAKIARQKGKKRGDGTGMVKIQYYAGGQVYSDFTNGYTNYYKKDGTLLVREKIDFRNDAPRLLDMMKKTYYDKDYRPLTGKVVLACPQYADVACETFSVENGILSGPYTKFEDLNGFYNEGLSRLWVMNYDRDGKVGKVLDLSSAEDSIISSEVYYFDDNTRFSLIYDGFNGPLTGAACGNMYINTRVFDSNEMRPVLAKFNEDRTKNPCSPEDLVITQEIVGEVSAVISAAEGGEAANADAGEVIGGPAENSVADSDAGPEDGEEDDDEESDEEASTE